MGSFFKKLEHFIVNLLIITLILLISIQILMKNETAYQRLQNIEFTVKNFFKQNQGIVEVIKKENNQIGFITIDLLQDQSLPQVWLVKNGKRVANFSKGIVSLKVEEGDFLIIDSKFYPQPLWFEVTSLSPSIKTWQLGQQFRSSGQELRLKVVQFYDKL